MKARIPAKSKLTKKQKQVAEEYVNNCENDVIRKFTKLACVTLSEEFGFGKSRMEKFILKFQEKATRKDEIYWWHVDKLLIDQIGIEFEREGEG